MQILRGKEEMRAWTRSVKSGGERVALVCTMGFLHEGHLSLVREAKQRADRVVVSIYVNPSQFAIGEDLDTYPQDIDADLEKLRSSQVDVAFLPKNLYAYGEYEHVVKAPQMVATDNCRHLTDIQHADDDASRQHRHDRDNHHQRKTSQEGVDDGQQGGGDLLSGESALVEEGDEPLKVTAPTEVATLTESVEPVGRHAAMGGNGLAKSCLDAEGGEEGVKHETWILVEQLQKPLCGISRPVFFRGVATVVAKLFHIVEADVAVFGKKDYQQWRVICRMVRDLDMAVDVVGAAVVREPDGLAMSSRNVRLSPEQRQKALSIVKSLRHALRLFAVGELVCSKLVAGVKNAIDSSGGIIDYVECVDQSTLRPLISIDRPAVIAVAAWFGNVRLIDNVEFG